MTAKRPLLAAILPIAMLGKPHATHEAKLLELIRVQDPSSETKHEREKSFRSALHLVHRKDWNRLSTFFRKSHDPISRVVLGYALWRVAPGRGDKPLIDSCAALSESGAYTGELDEILSTRESPNDLVKFPGDPWYFGAEAVMGALWSMARHGNRPALEACLRLPSDGDLAEGKASDIMVFIVENPRLTIRWWDLFEPELGDSVAEGFGAGYFSKAKLERAKRQYAAILPTRDPRRSRMLKWLDDPEATDEEPGKAGRAPETVRLHPD